MKKKMMKYQIRYVEKVNGEVLKAYEDNPMEVRETTDKLISEGKYVMEIYQWLSGQHRYARNRFDENYYNLFNQKESTKNLIKLMKEDEERA